MFTMIPVFDKISGNYRGEKVQEVKPKPVSNINLDDIDFESPIAKTPNGPKQQDDISKRLADIDFESPAEDTDELTPESDVAISQYEEPSMWERVKTFADQPLKSLETYGYSKVSPSKSFHITQLAEHFNVSPSTIEDDYAAYRRAYNPSAEPTFKGKVPQTMQLIIGAGLIHAPIPTLTNVLTFMGLDEVANVGVSAAKEDVDYEFGGSAGLAEIFEARGLSSDVLEVVEFIALGGATGKITGLDKSLMGGIARRLPKNIKYNFVNRVAKLIKQKGTSPDKAALEVSKEMDISAEIVAEAKARVMEAEVEANNIIKSRNKSVPKPKKKTAKGKESVSTRPEGVEPDYIFTSKRGNVYEKIGDKWYNKEGVEVKHEWVIKAAEDRKVKVEKPKVETDKVVEEPVEEMATGTLYRQTDPKVTRKMLDNSRDWSKIDTADGLVNRIELEVNSWLDGNNKIEIDRIKTLTDDLSKTLDDFAKGVETPRGIFSEMPLSEIENLNGYVKGLNEWVQKAERVPEKLSTNQLNTMIPLDQVPKVVSNAMEKARQAGRNIKFKDLHRNKKVWKKTGYWLGKDGKWRYEIDDSKANFFMPEGRKVAKIDEVLNYTELYETLPGIKYLRVVIDKKLEKGEGAYSHKNRTIYLRDPNNKKVFWHELQHAVNREAGSRFTGGSPEDFKGKLDAFSRYMKLPGEMEARLAEKRMSMSKADRKRIPPWETLDQMLLMEGRSGQGTKLYSVGGAIGEGIGKTFDKLTGRDKVRHLKPEYPDPINTPRGKAKEAVRMRRSKLDLQYYRTNKFVNEIMQKTNQRQREAVLFSIEKTDVPEALGRPDLQKILKKDKELIDNIAKDVKAHFNEGFKRTKKELPNMSVKQIEDYVTHIWDIPRNKRAEAANWFSTQNRFLERRFIDTYKEGIEKGYRPKTLDITEIIKIHDNVANRAIINKQFIDSIMKMGDESGIKLLMRTNNPPENYVEVDYAPLKRFVPGTRSGKAKGKGFVREAQIYAHPEIVRPLRTVFEERFDHPVIGAYEVVNGVMKKGLLTASLFHHGALMEVGIALGIPKETLNLYFNPVKVFKGIVKGEYELFKNQPLAEDAIFNGNVQFGNTADIPVGKIQGMLDNLANVSRGTPIANKFTELASSANKAWDNALWNYLHDTLKLLGYESLVSKIDPKLSLRETKLAKREIGQFINETFGGLKWDLLNVTPKEVQMMTWSLLSADWTVSTTRQALAVGGLGKVYNETAGLRKSMGRKFWLRAGLYFGVGMNALNAVMREKDMEENPQYYQDKEYTMLDKTMRGNSPGKKTYLFMGRYDDGTERYVRWGKQFRDFFELTIDPLYHLDGRKALKKLGGKAAPFPQTLVETFTGHTLSGYKNDDIYGAEGLEGTLNIFKNLGSNFMPISLRRYFDEDVEFKKLDIVMQSTKGMSRYSSMKYYKKALVEMIEAEDSEDLEDAEQRLKEIYVATLRNNLPAFTLFNQSLAWAKSEITAELTKDLDVIEDVEAKLDVAESPGEKARYGRLLQRLYKEKADKEQGIKLFNAAVSKARGFQIETGNNVKVDAPPPPSKRVIGNPGDREIDKRLDEITFD